MNPPFAPPKRDFIGKPAPPGYIAGIGRGATGFTTRSDIGPAREAAAAAAAAASGDDGLMRKYAKRSHDDDEEEEYLNESNYDNFAGYSGSLVNKDPYDAEDEEADKIYGEIERHLDERGKARREAKTRQQLEEYRQSVPKIQQQFSGLKAGLKKISVEEWMNIPDVGDARNRKQRVAKAETFTPVPDSLIAHQAKLAMGGEKVVYLDPKTSNSEAMDLDDDDSNIDNNSLLSTQVSLTDDSHNLNIGEMSDFRSSYMSMKLSHISNNVDSQTVTNPQDYLTNLQAKMPAQLTDAAAIQDYRKQFACLRAANPTLQNAWIASVRLEEGAGRIKAARALILEGCQKCPKSADLWCEAVRLHPVDIARAIMVRAVQANPKSPKLWIKAADLEIDDERKRKVYRKATLLVPKSVLLWKKSVELETPEEAKLILREAVKCCPEAIELWMALARLEPYEEAKKALSEASEKNPTDRSLWIMTAKLEEAAGHDFQVEAIIKQSIEQLSSRGVEVRRDEWMKEAMDAEKAGFKVTCKEIIKRIIGWNIGDGDRLKLWLEDAQRFIDKKSIDCARAVYDSIICDKNYCKTESVWRSFVNFERQYGNAESLETVLRNAIKVENCIKSESLWLMLANQRRKHLDETRGILSDALDANPDSEKIIIAAVELEDENSNYKEARRILADACMSAKTAQLVLRSAKLEWSLGNLDEAVRMLKAGVEEYKGFPDFYLMLGQIEEQRGDNDGAKVHYSSGLKYNPTSIALWISMANLEEKTGFIAKARSRLEMARLRNPKVPLLWLESARLEVRATMNKNGNTRGRRPEIATTILAKGIKECKDNPDVSLLYTEQAELSKRKFV